MSIIQMNTVAQFSVSFKLRTPLLLRTGLSNDVADNTIETDFDDRLHINGYVWAGLLRRALRRLQDYQHMAAEIGKYEPENSPGNAKAKGVSPLWTAASHVDLPWINQSAGFDVRPGIRISRQWGSAETGGLYSEETVPAGLANINLHFNYFCNSDDFENIKTAFTHALWVIDQGIETIGGGWSYGFGRLNVQSAYCRKLNLGNAQERSQIWSQTDEPTDGAVALDLHGALPAIALPWQTLKTTLRVQPGQLLAIHADAPAIDAQFPWSKLPDTFVFTRQIIDADNPAEITAEEVIPGKAIRQALLSVPIERKLRSLGESICLDSSKNHDTACTCSRCKWFGSTNGGGIVAVLDAPVRNAESTVLHRIQLCEHSMQNMNLFSGEYLTHGEFEVEIMIDQAREKNENDLNSRDINTHIRQLLAEMNPDKKLAPPGWYRLGATSTCAGQIEVCQTITAKQFGEVTHETSL